MISKLRTRAPRGALAGVLAATGLLAAHWSAPLAVSAPAARSAAAPAPLTLAQAEAQAAATGTAVLADALTTETTQTTVNPNGTATLSEAVEPVRVWRGGAWVGLDATLHRNADGTVSPNATPSALVLSGGGHAPLAVMTLGGRQLSITLPLSLPSPTLSGASATYPNVLPDTDLVVTATDQGGYSDVIVAKSAAAAVNPQLTDLLTATTASSGLNVAADQTGNITASDTNGHPVFTAPAPAMWDSTTTGTSTPTPAPSPSTTAAAAASRAASASTPADGVDPVSGLPLTSSVSGPGEHANSAPLHAAYTGATLTLTPSTALLTAASTTYPVYFDPSVAPTLSNWTMVNSNFPTTSYFNAGTGGEMQVGFNGWSTPYFTARSFVTLALPSVLSGASIQGASVTFLENVAPSCAQEEVDLYTTGSVDRTTTWNHQPSWNSKIGSQSVAYGYSGCTQHGVEFDITGQVASTLSGGGQQLTLGLRTPESAEGTAGSGYNAGGNDLYWKQFIGKNTTASITYNHPPAAPTLDTSPATNCQNQPLGDTGVNLLANPSDPDGGSLTTTFDLWKDSDPAQTNLLTPANGVNSAQISGSSGQPAALVLPETFFKTLAAGAVTAFDFKAQSTDTDGPATGPWSATCTFSWDPTRPGAPGVATNPSPPTGTSSCATTTTGSAGAPQPVGTTCSFTLTPPNGATISGYLYQVNQQPPITAATTGTVSVDVPLTRIVNTLTVDALSAGGNIGSPVTVSFDGTALSPPAKDGDLDNNGAPDLIVPGAPGSAFPPGLWLATGHPDATTDTGAVNIGINGLGYATSPTPTDWNGAQAVTGNFCGNGAQDVLAYYPTGANTSGGAVVCNDASTNPLHLTNPLTSDPVYRLIAPVFQDASGNSATQVANAGNTSGTGKARPDLLATINNQLYLFTSGTTTGYSNDNGFGCFQSCDQLTALNTPDGTQDWNSWTIATTQDTRNNAPVTDMYLWKPSTGALYLWTALTAGAAFPNATTLAYTQYPLHTGTGTDLWPSPLNSGLTLRAADINGDGLPDLWTTDPSTGIVTGYQLASLTGGFTTPVTTKVNTANHAWLLQDIGSNTAGNPLTTSTDSGSSPGSAGNLPLTGTSGAQWNTGDVYSPDALLNTNHDGTANTTGTGRLSTSGPALALGAADFTVSARVRAAALGGTVFSQDGANTAGITLTADQSTGDWQLCMARTDTTSPTRDCATGPPVHLGLWTELTTTYNHTTDVITLYVNSTDTATASHAPVSGFTGAFQIGAQRSAAGYTGYLAAQIAQVQVWDGAALPPGAWGSAAATTATGPDLYLTNGLIALYQVESDGNLWGASQNTPRGPFAAWQKLSTSGGLTGTPSTIQMPNGLIALYARTTTGQVQGTSQTAVGGAFSPLVTIGGTAVALAADPALILLHNGELALYGIGTDGNLWATTQTSAYGSWSPWTRLSTGTALTGRPALAQLPGGLITLYARTTAGQLQGATQSTPGGTLSAFTPVAGTGPTLAGDPRVVALSGGELSLYAIGTDANLYGTTQTTAYGPFTTWTQLSTSGAFTGRPAAIQVPDGQIGLYARTTSGQIQGTSQTSPGAAASPYIVIGGTGATLAGDPALLLIDNALAMYTPGTTNTVWGTNQTGPNGPWATWAVM